MHNKRQQAHGAHPPWINQGPVGPTRTLTGRPPFFISKIYVTRSTPSVSSIIYFIKVGMPQVVDKSTCKVSIESQFSETAQNRHFNRHNGARLPIRAQ
jgi:hypothetical protein